jgi:plasmid stabilization system protein ParE
MIFTVTWEPDAEDELARIWLQYPNKNAIAAASDRMDTALRVDPQLQGDPHLGPTRVLLDPPLGIIFLVDEPDRRVRVVAVWYIPPYTDNGQAGWRRLVRNALPRRAAAVANAGGRGLLNFRGG